MKQVLITPSAGKLLIAKALANHPAIQSAMKNGTLVLVAGTTNGYLAQEMLQNLGLQKPFQKPFFPRNQPAARPTHIQGGQT